MSECLSRGTGNLPSALLGSKGGVRRRVGRVDPPTEWTESRSEAPRANERPVPRETGSHRVRDAGTRKVVGAR